MCVWARLLVNCRCCPFFSVAKKALSFCHLFDFDTFFGCNVAQDIKLRMVDVAFAFCCVSFTSYGSILDVASSGWVCIVFVFIIRLIVTSLRFLLLGMLSSSFYGHTHTSILIYCTFSGLHALHGYWLRAFEHLDCVHTFYMDRFCVLLLLLFLYLHLLLWAWNAQTIGNFISYLEFSVYFCATSFRSEKPFSSSIPFVYLFFCSCSSYSLLSTGPKWF